LPTAARLFNLESGHADRRCRFPSQKLRAEGPKWWWRGPGRIAPEGQYKTVRVVWMKCVLALSHARALSPGWDGRSVSATPSLFRGAFAGERGGSAWRQRRAKLTPLPHVHDPHQACTVRNIGAALASAKTVERARDIIPGTPCMHPGKLSIPPPPPPRSYQCFNTTL
jgi:hypothetical protein